MKKEMSHICQCNRVSLASQKVFYMIFYKKFIGFFKNIKNERNNVENMVGSQVDLLTGT